MRNPSHYLFILRGAIFGNVANAAHYSSSTNLDSQEQSNYGSSLLRFEQDSFICFADVRPANLPMKSTKKHDSLRLRIYPRVE